jgi:predicted nucleic acid-binding Zn ribbon protein
MTTENEKRIYTKEEIKENKGILKGIRGEEEISLRCDHCGKVFSRWKKSVIRAIFKRGGVITCSRACGYALRSLPVLDKTCKQCGEVFQTKREEARFCSKGCEGDFRRAPKVERECLSCGKTFTTSSSTKGHLTCSDECRLEWNRERQKKASSEGCLQRVRQGV